MSGWMSRRCVWLVGRAGCVVMLGWCVGMRCIGTGITLVRDPCKALRGVGAAHFKCRGWTSKEELWGELGYIGWLK